MDILSFLNSDAIRNHLREINYQFNTLEAAWIIYHCRHLSFEGKKTAWEELMNTMDDCEIPARLNCKGWDSLFSFLKEYIQITENEAQNMMKKEPVGSHVYGYTYTYLNDDRWTEEYQTAYSSIQSCLEAYQSDVADLDETYSPKITGVNLYRLRKQSLSDVNQILEVEYYGDGALKQVIINSLRTEAESDVISNSFEGLWFNFPTPFEEGDIVWMPSDKNHIFFRNLDPFYLEGIITWNANEYIHKSGDESDMCAYGLWLNSDGSIFHEVEPNYMDLEYFGGPFSKKDKFLVALSMYKKGKIELDLLINVYRKYVMDIVSNENNLRNWYCEDVLRELGIE